MTWFRVDDKLHDHGKVRRLRTDKPAAIGVWALCGSWAADNLTDGFVPAEVVQRFDPKERYAKRLVDVGLWVADEQDGEEGYRFHEWVEHQPTRAEVQKRRDENRDRVRRWRERNGAGNDSSDGDRNALHGPSVTPPPTRPDPTRPEEGKDSLAPLADHTDPDGERDLFGGSPSAPGEVVPIRRKAEETFSRFWELYPRKKAKQGARKAWDKAIKGADPDVIIQAAGRLADSRPDPRYTPYPATWLNRGSWEDEPDPVRAASGDGYRGWHGPADQSEYDQEF